MSDWMWEPGRSPSGFIRTGIKPVPLDAVLRSDVPAAEGEQKTAEMQPGELSASEVSLTDQLSEELQEVLEHWAEGSLKNLVLEIQEQLTDALLSWEPSPQKSEQENLHEVQETVRRHSEVLSSKGAALKITKPLEEALLEALAKWLEQTAAGLLRLLGSADAADEVKSLLEMLFRQITGVSPSKGRVSACAATLCMSVTGHRQPARGRVEVSAEGVLYRKAAGGARLDRSYSNQAQRTAQQAARSVNPAQRADVGSETNLKGLTSEKASPRFSVVSPESEIVRQLRFAENFAKSISTQPVLPGEKEIPFVSEERLGLELGLLWLKGEAAAREPGITAHTAALIRQATEQRTESFLYEAGCALQLAARGYPLGQCPNLWREDVLRVREEVIRRYRLTKDAQQSLLETIAYAVELFREKQGSGKYRSWLRYLPGRGLFLHPFGWEDIKQGWQELCRSWERFLQEMRLQNSPAFQGIAVLQGILAMLVPPPEKTENGDAVSLWSLAVWLFAAAAAAAVVCAVWPGVSPPIRVVAVIAALFSFGAAFLLLRRGKKG